MFSIIERVIDTGGWNVSIILKDYFKSKDYFKIISISSSVSIFKIGLMLIFLFYYSHDLLLTKRVTKRVLIFFFHKKYIYV